MTAIRTRARSRRTKPKPKPNEIVIDFSAKYEPNPRQIEAHSRPERYILYGGAVGGGKSWWLCASAVQKSLDVSGNRGFLCRHENTSFMKSTYLTLKRLLPEEAVVKENQHQQWIEFINGSRIYYGGLRSVSGADAKERLKSMELGWFAIDEASETSEELFLWLGSRLRLQSDYGEIRYSGLLTSNPEPGWVRYRFVDQKLPNHAFIRALPTDNPDLPADYVAELRALYPDDWVKQYIEGDWDAAMGAEERHVFPYLWVMRAVNRDPNELLPVEVGVDPGRGGDESVVALRRGEKIELLFAAQLRDTMELIGRVLDYVDEYKPTAVKVDATGLGGPIVDRLREHPSMKNILREYMGGWSPKSRERFFNNRSETHWNLRLRLQENRLSLPDDRQLESELVAIRFNIKSDKRVYIETKEEMRHRGVKSPNRADAVMLAFAEGGGGAAPDIFLI